MLRISTSILFILLMIVSVFASFSLAEYVLYPSATGVHPMIWCCFAMAALVFVMSCIGLFVLITTKAHITMVKTTVAETQPETKKHKKK